MRHGIWISAIAFTLICWTAAMLSSSNSQPSRSASNAEERLLQCGYDLCDLVNKRGPQGTDIKCDLTQTWRKETISKAIAKGRLSWPYGDAHCSGTFAVSRALLAPALTEASYKLKVPPQPIHCEVENGGSAPHTVKGNMAPEIKFESGKATSVSLGLQDIDGTVVLRNAVWAAWKFESTFGYFQKDFIKGVNEFISEYCSGPGKK